MTIRKRSWDLETLRRHTAVVRGEAQPTKVLFNGKYLNTYLKRWESANIWIDGDRIVYVGQQLPKQTEGVQMIDCENRYLVPGYIEPHAHPTQLYNPQTLAEYAARRGTTTLVCDNFVFYLTLPDELTFEIMDRLDSLPTSLYWWCRYDPQTAMLEDPFISERIRKWMRHPLVIQGGELTSWPQVLKGDDQILDWMQETKALGKPVEGHLPGASKKTLTQMRLLGIDCDHEAMTGEEAVARLQLGLTTSLRYSSIRPDLPQILTEMLDLGVKHFGHVYMTTDGSTPAYYEQGLADRLVLIALEQGISDIDAYMMASANIADHYNMNGLVGHIAPGRLAHINILTSPGVPLPESVLARGEWVKKNGEYCYDFYSDYDFKDDLKPLKLNWSLHESALKAEKPVGIDMINAVITKPLNFEKLPEEHDLPEDLSFLSLVDRQGGWIINTFVRGFAKGISGFASSFSNTGDVILLGRHKADMIIAFNKIKETGGGIVLAEEGKIAAEIKLPVSGGMSDQPLVSLIEEEKVLTSKLRERGYQFEDPIYSLLFFSSTHLPYIRITQQGLYDVMKQRIIEPSRRIIT
ncbi:adenine deaminase [Scopulibacillus darangshiensis]|uniref:adenine deaminase n=1 Tax=Scopulibacillus darangshiensis TaxID=442528 RepID=A0A4R2NRT3_9BACL|nr:adenine deaminase C-terminal domain-containing protein [Scopulibacillus darangshiensis]TCP24108.1 adenine deaminase [Scopulibacillus darangshiensis]